AQMRSKQMFGKSDLADNLGCDLSRARNKRDALASDIIALSAEIAVLEASLLTENDRRERERAASEFETIKKQVNDQYLAFVSTIAGIRGATEMAAAIVAKARELDELLLPIATEAGNAIGDLLSDLDRRIKALRVRQVAPELPQSFKESEARRKANDEECIRVFKAADYKVVEPRFNVLTYKKWLEKGRRVKKGEKGFSVGPFKLFHEDQTEVNGSFDLPLPIERVIPPQPKDNDPVLRLPEWLRRNSRAKKETSEDQCSTAASTMHCARKRGGGPLMRVLHFADIAVAVTTFVAMYLLFNGEEQLPNPRANQLENIQGRVLAQKSDRLAIPEEEDTEDQVYSSKLVRLEIYDLPYLADYAYSEVPPDKRPADIALDSLKDIPVGTPVEEIKRASDAFGLDFNFMKAIAKIESGFDPKQRTGSYIGLFQLSKDEFAQYGSGDILDARDNAVAAACKFANAAILFELSTHKKATFSDLYLIHQQGTRGAEEHVNHPDRIAWKSMCATDEGKEKGEKWCKRAIWENTLPEVKRVWKSVDNLTSGVFVQMWQDQVKHFYTRYSEATTN
ncbi:MAG TPA: hypothetical protein VGU90_08085, partial [Terriglobales bacterium]|nr:hypothetical protein [Terriglobales bacterium]